MRPVIVLGDSTSHGETVLEGATATVVEGTPVAREGDRVSCPINGYGPCTIVSGDATTVIEGKAVARHGDQCSCGATLIASITDTGML